MSLTPNSISTTNTSITALVLEYDETRRYLVVHKYIAVHVYIDTWSNGWDEMRRDETRRDETRRDEMSRVKTRCLKSPQLSYSYRPSSIVHHPSLQKTLWDVPTSSVKICTSCWSKSQIYQKSLVGGIRLLLIRMMIIVVLIGLSDIRMEGRVS